METKKYSSYKQIDADLDILRLEREIHYQKMLLQGKNTLESFKPGHLVRGFFGSYKSILFDSSKEILSTGIKYITKWFMNRKRGH
jgi:hypothetical protein